MGGAVGVALERRGADVRARLRIDELLVNRFRRQTDPLGDMGERGLRKVVKQGQTLLPIEGFRDESAHSDRNVTMSHYRHTCGGHR